MVRVLVIWHSPDSEPRSFVIDDVGEGDLIHLRECHNCSPESVSDEEHWSYVVHRLGTAWNYSNEDEFKRETEDTDTELTWEQYGIWKEGKPGETGGASLYFLLHAQDYDWY